MVYNTHQRETAAPASEVGLLIDSLASKNDRLWPRHEWPAMRFDGPLNIGAAGGHGPVRYFVTAYEPGRRIEFQFTGPSGFNGHHSFTAISLAGNTTMLRHELSMVPSGTAKLTWPLFFRPMHDALIEESLDRAENDYSSSPNSAHRRSLWTKILRAPFSARMTRK
ncbi:SRPBCC family protein [Arthrobacter sp. TMN-49]